MGLIVCVGAETHPCVHRGRSGLQPPAAPAGLRTRGGRFQRALFAARTDGLRAGRRRGDFPLFDSDYRRLRPRPLTLSWALIGDLPLPDGARGRRPYAGGGASRLLPFLPRRRLQARRASAPKPAPARLLHEGAAGRGGWWSGMRWRRCRRRGRRTTPPSRRCSRGSTTTRAAAAEPRGCELSAASAGLLFMSCHMRSV